jgi:hypothetical protein
MRCLGVVPPFQADVSAFGELCALLGASLPPA